MALEDRLKKRFAFTVVPSPNQSLDNTLVTAHQRLCSESARSGVQPHFTSRTQSDICIDHNTQKCMWIKFSKVTLLPLLVLFGYYSSTPP